MAKSTGPRTAKAKVVLDQNTAKTWISSQRILESEETEAATLYRGFIDDFQPECLIEKELIDDLVLNRLVRRRIDAAFTREFSKASAIKPAQLLERRDAGATAFWMRSELRRGRRRGESSPRAHADLCVAVLEELAESIRDCGLQPYEDLEVLRCLYGTEFSAGAGAIADTLKQLWDLELMGELVQDQDREETKHAILKDISKEVEYQKWLAEIDTEVNDIEIASLTQEPPAAVLNALLRYRTANRREFESLVESLETVRRIRQSEAS